MFERILIWILIVAGIIYLFLAVDPLHTFGFFDPIKHGGFGLILLISGVLCIYFEHRERKVLRNR